MTKSDWFAIEEAAGAAIGWGFAGDTPVIEATGLSATEVATLLDAHDPLIVAEPAAADQKSPARVLPDRLPMAGIAQGNPPDRLPPVARLRIAGFLAAHLQWDGVICLSLNDATHWVQISADELVSLQSTLTPRLAAALGAGPQADTDAVEQAISRPEKLASLLHRAALTSSPDMALGALIGAELAATRPYWLGQQIGLIADAPLAHAYAAALALQFAPLVKMTPHQAAQNGLIALHRAMA